MIPPADAEVLRRIDVPRGLVLVCTRGRARVVAAVLGDVVRARILSVELSEPAIYRMDGGLWKEVVL